jgi:hypothetical protein
MASTKPGLQPRGRPSRRKFDHDAAFDYWLNPGGQRRSYNEVARQFGVAEPSVLRVASFNDWPARAWEIEQQAHEAAAKRAVKTVAQRIEEDLRLIDAGKLAVARRLQAGTIVADLGDLVALVKLEQVLVGGPSERIAGETEQHRRSLEEIEAELAGLEPAQVDALIEADEAVTARLAVAELPVGEPVAAGDDGPEDSPVSMPDATSAPPVDEAEVVDGEVVEERERPDGVTVEEWRQAREANPDAWMGTPGAKGPMQRAAGWL